MIWSKLCLAFFANTLSSLGSVVLEQGDVSPLPHFIWHIQYVIKMWSSWKSWSHNGSQEPGLIQLQWELNSAARILICSTWNQWQKDYIWWNRFWTFVHIFLASARLDSTCIYRLLIFINSFLPSFLQSVLETSAKVMINHFTSLVAVVMTLSHNAAHDYEWMRQDKKSGTMKVCALSHWGNLFCNNIEKTS